MPSVKMNDNDNHSHHKHTRSNFQSNDAPWVGIRQIDRPRSSLYNEMIAPVRQWRFAECESFEKNGR
jgi:hypothetical protein